jgi:fatty-acyl-CoA synthase
MKEKGMEERRKKFIERYPTWEKRTLYECFAAIANESPDRPFFIEEKAATYSQILREVHRSARYLKSRGIKKGDRVILNMENRIEFVYLTFAIAAVGAVKVPVNRNIGNTELLHIINQTTPKILVTDSWEDARYLDIVSPRMDVIYAGEAEEPIELSGKMTSWKECCAGLSAEALETWDRDADGVSDIIYTSGSTGHPKGAMLSHDMLLRSAHASCINRGFEDGRRIYIPIPLYHVYGYVEGLLAAMLVGGSIVVSRGKFGPDRALAIIEKTRANDVLAIPSIISKMLVTENLQKYNLTSLHAVYCSASICPDWIWKDIKSRLHVDEITTGYGMTEVCGASTQNDPSCDLEVLENYLGSALYGDCAGIPEADGRIIEYKVLDLVTHQEVEPGKSGELICRGPVVMKGYYKQDDVNARVFDENGWFHTGDIGYFTEEGYLKLLGRKNDSYKINGENVSPQFLDYIISKCRDVMAVETVGVPNEKLGYSGVAFIEPICFNAKTEERIIEYCEKELASFQRPQYFFFEYEDKWEKTSSGKVKKTKLREIAQKRIHGRN